MKNEKDLDIIVGARPYEKSEEQDLLNSPKIVGETKHYSPANKEWKTSIYAYNKNNMKSLTALDKIANQTIKSYFDLASNKKLARSKRMRTLIRRKTVKKLFVSRSEIKHTSDKVNLTVYVFNREKQFLLRKMYFFNRDMFLNKDIYLYKLWLKKNLSAFNRTFNQTELIKLHKNNIKNSRWGRKQRFLLASLKTNRDIRNKTYIHNVLFDKYLVEGPNRLMFRHIQEGLPYKPNLLNKINFNVLGSIKNRNFIKSKQKRNLIRFLKKWSLTRSLHKREEKKLSFMLYTRIKLSGFKNEPSNLLSNKTLALQDKGSALNHTRNYFGEKITQKVRLILRNKHAMKKIRQKLQKLKRSRFGKIRLPYSNLKFKNEVKFFSFRLVSELRYIRKLFFFYFIKYILNLFHIKIKIEENSRGKSLHRLMYEFSILDNIQSKHKGEVFKHLESKQSSLSQNKKKNKKIKFINRYPFDKLKDIEKLNLELLNFLKLILAEVGGKKPLTLFKGEAFKKRMDHLYKNFEKSYFLAFLSQFFKKEFLYLNYYSKFLLNQLKFGKLLPGLKILISNIYSKKVELNLINLKYPHLNSDIYADAITTKLKNKIGLLKVMKWSLKLARLPNDYYSKNNLANLNKLQNLNIHESLDVNALSSKSFLSDKLGSSEDKLHLILNKLFPHSLTYGFSKKSFLLRESKASSLYKKELNEFNRQSSSFVLKNGPFKPITAKSITVLNNLRYKWVSGVRLEAAGRLTRRYTAARSVFKFRYKGSLKNIDYSLKADPSQKNISTVMLRNNVKPNSQYTFGSSKKRIGAFGLKAWVSSY